MNTKELAGACDDVFTTTKKEIDVAIEEAERKFELTDGSNEEISNHLDIYKEMINLKLNQTISSSYKKLYEVSKNKLNSMLERAGVDIESEEGIDKVIFKTNGLVFSKKENKTTNSCSVTDLKIELAKAGVDKSVIDAAEKAASKPRRGNTYYSIAGE